MATPEPWVVVCMGVSATGKSTIAERLAQRLDVEYEEGDSHHPPANIDKMEAGTPLTDEDRWPWLRDLAGIVADRHDDGRSTVLTCSALKRSYRDVLRSRMSSDRVYFVHLHGDYDLLLERMDSRDKHFMPRSLLTDQFDTLEPLGADEHGVLVDVGPGIDDVVDTAARAVTDGLGLAR